MGPRRIFAALAVLALAALGVTAGAAAAFDGSGNGDTVAGGGHAATAGRTATGRPTVRRRPRRRRRPGRGRRLRQPGRRHEPTVAGRRRRSDVGRGTATTVATTRVRSTPAARRCRPGAGGDAIRADGEVSGHGRRRRFGLDVDADARMRGLRRRHRFGSRRTVGTRGGASRGRERTRPRRGRGGTCSSVRWWRRSARHCGRSGHRGPPAPTSWWSRSRLSAEPVVPATSAGGLDGLDELPDAQLDRRHHHWRDQRAFGGPRHPLHRNRPVARRRHGTAARGSSLFLAVHRRSDRGDRKLAAARSGPDLTHFR